jgi:hypothetical protein
MASRPVILAASILFCQLDLAAGQVTTPGHQASSIRTVPSETITDLAVAYADPTDPVIYYNPRLMERYGPELSAFVLAHERAHIGLGHRRPPAGPDGGAIERLLQGWELEADCLAAAGLHRDRPAALRTAIAFFHQMGHDRVDREHPTGHARAARLEDCGQTQNGDPRSTTTATFFK